MGKKYLENEDLVGEITRSVEKDNATNELGRMLMLMTERIGAPFPYKSFELRQDVYADTVEHAIKQFRKYDGKRFDNAFSWYTSVILNKLKRALTNATNKGVIMIPLEAISG